MSFLSVRLWLLLCTALLNTSWESHGNPICKFHDSRKCITTKAFRDEKAQGCTSIDGNCRKVFCNECLSMVLEGQTMDTLTTVTCGLECTIPQVLVRYDPPDREFFYKLGAKAYEIKNKVRLSPSDLGKIQNVLSFYMNYQTDELEKMRAESTSYALKSAFTTSGETLIKSQAHQWQNAAARTQSRARHAVEDFQDDLDNRVQQVTDDIEGYTARTTAKATRLARDASRKADRLAQETQRQTQRLSEKAAQGADELTQRANRLNREIQLKEAHRKKAVGSDRRQLDRDIKAKRRALATLTRSLPDDDSEDIED